MSTEPRVSRLSTSLDRTTRPDPEWSIEGVLPPTGVCTLFGETYTGKSFVTLDLALRICNGLTDWYGHQINVSGPVVYVFMEGVFDQQRRIDAWLIAHPGTTDENLYTLDEQALNLADRDSLLLLLDDIRLVNITPELLIVDTQALALPGTEENDNGEMGRVLSLLKQVSTKVGYPILTVHHTGYDTSHARGASAWKAGLDLEIHVRQQEVKVSKAKGAQATKWLEFRLTQSGKSVWAKPGIGGDGVGVKGVSQKIVDLIDAHAGQLTKSQVCKQLGNTAKVIRAFDDLASSEEIVAVEIERAEGGRKAPVKRTVWVVNDEVTLDLSEMVEGYDAGDDGC